MSEMPQGAPIYELHRSTAAQRVGALAQASGLFMAHYEYRVRLPTPEAWVTQDRPDLGAQPNWTAGVLPEPKYQSFRHDLLLGSFHPSHRAKWTAHELCHGLVGFAWRPDGAPLFHALAARLAEVLPVALWYFFDEVDLRRCPKHQGQGPLYASHCQACELAAQAGPLPEQAHSERWWDAGRIWVESELAAIASSRRLGRMVPYRFGTLDLSSDSLAYASQHAQRLNSDAFHRFVSTFFEQAQGHHATLDDLEARIVELLDYLCGYGTARPWQCSPSRWAAMDIGWRLLSLMEDTDGDANRALDAMVDVLATDREGERIEEVVDAYRALYEDYEVPSPEDVFAVGYPLAGGLGLSTTQAAAGVASACPRAWSLMGEGALERVAQFTHHDEPGRWERRGLGRRFADYLEQTQPGPLADLARFEAAVTHVAAADPEGVSLGSGSLRGGEVRTVEGLELVSVGCDVLSDELTGFETPAYLLVWGSPGGDANVVDVSEDMAEAVARLAAAPSQVEDVELSPEEVESLLDLGVIVPTAWEVLSLPETQA